MLKNNIIKSFLELPGEIWTISFVLIKYLKIF